MTYALINGVIYTGFEIKAKNTAKAESFAVFFMLSTLRDIRGFRRREKLKI